MKQKMAVLLLLVLLVVVGVIAYKMYGQQQADIQALQKENQVSHKQVADLNDRLAALARQQQNEFNFAGIAPGNNKVLASLNAAQQLQLEVERSELLQLKQQWVQANLQLAQDTFFQSRFDVALLLLQQTQQHIINTEDSHKDPFNLALLEAIKNDQQQIKQTMLQHRQVQLSLDRSLAGIQQQLIRFSQAQPVYKTAVDGAQGNTFKSWIKNMVMIEKAPPEMQQLALDRLFVYKQSNLLINMARQALAQDNQMSLNGYLQDVLTVLKPFGDADSKTIYDNVRLMQQQRLPVVKSLSSLALLTTQKAAS